ncbi:MAG: BolA family protein [Candidatus Binatia bacterium]
MEASEIEQRVREAIPESDVEAADLKGSGDHFGLRVVSPVFEDHSLVQRHRMVYEALGDAMRAEIHALTIEALTPDEHRQGLSGDIERG